MQDGAIRTTKRTQGVRRPCDRAPKSVSSCEPTSSNQRKAALQSRNDLAAKSTGVKEQGMQTEDPPGTWETLPFPLTEQWLGKPRTKQPRPGDGVPTSSGETNNRAQGGTAKRRQRSAAGRATGVGAARSSGEGGEPNRGTQWSEGAAKLWNQRKERRRGIELENRLNVWSLDSIGGKSTT